MTLNYWWQDVKNPPFNWTWKFAEQKTPFKDAFDDIF